MALTDKLTAIADAIRGKTGRTDALTLDQMAEAVAGLSSSGDSSMSTLIDGTITEISDDTVKTIQLYKFFQCSELQTANFPEATIVAAYAFQGCGLLHTVNIPKATMVGVYGFSGTAITVADFPHMVTVNDYAFSSCKRLATINLPEATTVEGYAFQWCSSLKNVVLPKVSAVTNYLFANCAALESIDFGAATSIAKYAFNYCSSLKTLILRNTNQVCSLVNMSMFFDTPFEAGGTGGTVYVPEALIESYKAASYWSSLYNYGTCNFVAIEGSEYE